ncbi:MAG: addiction module protein [Bacteroidota bacterium]
MSETFHVKIKKDYAAAILKDLEKMDAVELLIEDDTIPEWQVNLVNERMAEYKKNPGIALDFDEAMDDIEKDL